MVVPLLFILVGVHDSTSVLEPRYGNGKESKVAMKRFTLLIGL